MEASKSIVARLLRPGAGETLPYNYSRVRGTCSPTSSSSSLRTRWLSSTRQITIFIFTTAFVIFSSLAVLSTGRKYAHVLGFTQGNAAVESGYPNSPSVEPLAPNCTFRSPLSALGWPLPEVGEEVYSANGLVYYTPNASTPTRHPIISLLKDGEEKWKRMVSAQSRTLDNAVREYKRRNDGRRPPKGFDKWFHWCRLNHVLLPDELAPLPASFKLWHAIPPAERYARQQEAESVQRSFIFVHDANVTNRSGSKAGDGLKIVWPKTETRGHYWGRWFVNPKRSQAQFDLMKDVAHLLPSFRAVINIDDQPVILPSPGRREELEAAADQRSDSSNLDEEDTSTVDWEALCKASEAAKRKAPFVEEGQVSFIHDPDAALDPCLHPSLIKSHGLFLTHRTPTDYPRHHNKLLPVFSHSTTKRHADFVLTPVGFEGKIQHAGGEDGPWEEKMAKLYWRGSPTGMHNQAEGGRLYHQSHRERLDVLLNAATGSISHLLTSSTTHVATLTTSLASALNNKYFDVKLTSSWLWQLFAWWPEGAQQCVWSDGTCDDMQKSFTYSAREASNRGEDFKYTLSIDGNGWSARLSRLMSSKNLVLKTTIFPEWNSLFSPAWYTFVPIQNSYDDIYNVMDFFTSNDEVARIIGENGKCWNEKTWRKEDMQAFMVLSLLEYARLFTPGHGDLE